MGQRGRSASPLRRASLLDASDLEHAALEGPRHGLVHLLGIVALDEVGGPAIAAEEALQLLVGDAREQSRVVDLVAVQVEDRQHGAVAHGIEELVGVPRRGQGARLGLAVSDHHRDEEVGVVERRAEGVGQAVAELAPLVNRSRRLRRAVAADPAREGELPEELAHPLLVLALVGVDLGVGALQVDRAQYAGRTVPGTRQEDRVEVGLADQPVQVDVGEGESRARAPVAEQTLLDVLWLQRLSEQGVVLEVDHSYGQVVARPPVGVDRPQLVCAEGIAGGNGGFARHR